jgi:hypothetical protein
LKMLHYNLELSFFLPLVSAPFLASINTKF